MGLLSMAMGKIGGGGDSAGSSGSDKQSPLVSLLKRAKTKAGESMNRNKMMPSYKRGGKVKRTGAARLHKGEQVLNTKQAKRYRRGKGKRGRKR